MLYLPNELLASTFWLTFFISIWLVFVHWRIIVSIEKELILDCQVIKSKVQILLDSARDIFHKNNNNNNNIGHLYCAVPILIYSTAHYIFTDILLPRNSYNRNHSVMKFVYPMHHKAYSSLHSTNKLTKKAFTRTHILQSLFAIDLKSFVTKRDISICQNLIFGDWSCWNMKMIKEICDTINNHNLVS